MRSNNTPLDVATLYPLTTDKRPPVSVDDVPDDSTSSPPAPLLPEPTVTYIAPPLPDDAIPEPIYREPLRPFVEAPVLSTIIPLTPKAPESADRTKIEPLLVELE